jgi:hypothetical protein
MEKQIIPLRRSVLDGDQYRAIAHLADYLKRPKTSETVIPVEAGIQDITDFIHSNILDPGVRRGDEEFFQR